MLFIMLELTTKNLELRGLVNTTSKKGNVYYVLHCETIEGAPVKFFCRDAAAFPQSLKKGDIIQIDLVYNNFKDLEIKKVIKVDNN